MRKQFEKFQNLLKYFLNNRWLFFLKEFLQGSVGMTNICKSFLKIFCRNSKGIFLEIHLNNLLKNARKNTSKYHSCRNSLKNHRQIFEEISKKICVWIPRKVTAYALIPVWFLTKFLEDFRNESVDNEILEELHGGFSRRNL